MLCSIKDLEGCDLVANDGEIGRVREVYFDDERWGIRYLVVDTGNWLARHEVLISPHSISRLDRGHSRLEVNLSRQQIQDAPDIDTDKSVARQHETAYHDYYGHPYYWDGLGMWGVAGYPMGGTLVAGQDQYHARERAVPDDVSEMAAAAQRSGDPHLRSSSEVTGYDVHASDGSIGHIDDFLFDDRSWAIRYAVVDTHNWLPDRLVLMPPQSIASVDWSNGKVDVNLTRAAVKASPPYERGAPMPEQADQRVSQYYETQSHRQGDHSRSR